MAAEDIFDYNFVGPRMDASVPPTKVAPGSFGRIVGADGRYMGGLRKFWGMSTLVDLDGVSGLGDIDTYSGPSFFKAVTFQKRGTSTVYRGFVIRWDSQNSPTNQQVDLVYTADNGSTWARHAIWAAGNGITNALEIDCATDRGYLFVFVDTKAPKTVYWNGAALATVDMGPGAFSVELAALTSAATPSVDSSYHLRGDGTYQVAWRFYDSTRGIYSGLSAPVTIYVNQYKLSTANGAFYSNSGGGDSGLLVDGDTFTINGRTYEADDDSSYTGDVQVDITGLTTIAECCHALADAINGDSSATVTARAEASSVFIEAVATGAGGNAYAISVSEAGASTDDWTASGATLTGGGEQTTTPEPQCKAIFDFPNDDAVVATKTYSDFSALFDTVDVFRTIDLGDAAATQGGAIFYLEQTIAKAGNWATEGAWDSLQVTIGTVVDEALPFRTMWNPEQDIVASPPASGTVGRYQGITFAGAATSDNGGYDTHHSSLEHVSAEYFTTFNRRRGSSEQGRPLRYIPAADSMFVLTPSSVTHVYKAGATKPLQFVDLHQNRGLVAKGAAHQIGNSIVMVSGTGLVVLNGNNGSIGQITAADRILLGDWRALLSTIESASDGLFNVSWFLCPSRYEIIAVWHGTQLVTMLEGANFVGVTSCPDIYGAGDVRSYFITATGRIVYPNQLRTTTGNMWGLTSSYTFDGTATTAAAYVKDASATYHADMVGALCYMTSGSNAGEYRVINTVDVGNKKLTFVTEFDNQIAVGDRYSIAPVPFSARCWPIQDLINDDPHPYLRRKTLTGIQLAVESTSGISANPNAKFRIGAYRNGGTTLQTNTTEISIGENPADCSGHLQVDGNNVEPYIEQIACDVDWELTAAMVRGRMSSSRHVE